jgi:hypothetical protein
MKYTNILALWLSNDKEEIQKRKYKAFWFKIQYGKLPR